MDTRQREFAASVGLLILRLGMGGLMVSHGWGKAVMVAQGKFAEFGDPIGIGNTASLLLATFAEFVCAGLIVIGLLTRLAAVPIVVTMCVAAFVVHRADPWTMEQAFKLFMAGQTKFPMSKEPALLYLIPFLALVFTGPGRISVDAVLWRGRGRSRATAG